MLPIRQTLNQLAPLNRTLRAVLIEVCELAENGKHGAFTGHNDHLATRLIATNRTISRSLAELQRLGLLLISGSTTKRRIVAAPMLRTCYTGSEAANLAAVSALCESLSIDKTAEVSIDNQGLSIDNGGQCLETSEVVSIDIQGRVYIETNKDEHKTNIERVVQEVASLRSALASLQSDLAQASSDRDKLLEEVTTLKANAQASRTKGAGASLNADDYQLPAWAGEQFKAEFTEWLTARQKHRSGKLQAASIQKQLNELANYDQAYCSMLFDKAIKTGYQGLTFDDTPLKFAQYLQAQQPSHEHSTHHVFGSNPAPRYGQRPAPTVSSQSFGSSPVSLTIARTLAQGVGSYDLDSL